jgi:hypothetical protein
MLPDARFRRARKASDFVPAPHWFQDLTTIGWSKAGLSFRGDATHVRVQRGRMASNPES